LPQQQLLIEKYRRAKALPSLNHRPGKWIVDIHLYQEYVAHRQCGLRPLVTFPKTQHHFYWFSGIATGWTGLANSRGPEFQAKKMCTWVKVVTDLQILGCELRKNAFGGRAVIGPAGEAIALLQTPQPF